MQYDPSCKYTLLVMSATDHQIARLESNPPWSAVVSPQLQDHIVSFFGYRGEVDLPGRTDHVKVYKDASLWAKTSIDKSVSQYFVFGETIILDVTVKTEHLVAGGNCATLPGQYLSDGCDCGVWAMPYGGVHSDWCRKAGSNEPSKI